ncbi:MAG: hypothetical protein HOV81_41050 [Kofleriaceae bacterium]|nr:hypothetical protein [Kofleriaceae bacterium]
MFANVPLKGTVAIALLATALLAGSRAFRESPAVSAPSVLGALPDVNPQLETEAALAAHENVPEVPYEQPIGGMIPAAEPCTRPTVDEQIALHDRITAWIDRRYRREVSNAAEWTNLSFGCMEGTGIVVNANADRMTKGKERPDVGRWWLLRVTRDRIVPLAETRGSPVNDWMEWVIEASIETLALVDFDRDGAHDALFVRKVQEGGAITATYDISIALATGRTTFVGHRDLELDDVILEPHGVVLVTGRRYAVKESRYCIRGGLELRRCR